MTGTSLLVGNLLLKVRQVLLLILDGWGVGKNDESNPIFLAQTPVWDKSGRISLHPAGSCWRICRFKTGKAGNSEAGHMNIGAGRVVLQDDVRLDNAMQDGSFDTNDIFLQVIADVKQHHSSLHLISLLSEKSSHGSIDYPLALLRLAKARIA